MSGGGGGVIIIQRFAESPDLSDDDRKKLLAIADRSVVRCSFGDAVSVCRIVWKLLRK